ncbi:MAG: TerC family protein [Planctomycetota bacterium]|nr:MAG: TerC family protein [Planctomycetota bacterium]
MLALLDTTAAAAPSIGSPLLWAGFLAFVLAMLALDLGVFHRSAHEVSLKEAATWSLVWVSLALVFCAGVWHFHGEQKGLEFATGYLIEKALSVDNIFVFVVVFGYFGIPRLYQHRVLFWGILGALAMRAAFIVAGSALLQRFHWLIYVFGALLVLTGIKLLAQRGQEVAPDRNPVLKLVRRFVPVTQQTVCSSFTLVENGRRVATPLLLALLVVELSDLVFAIDSIPAIFAVTTDPFVVFTSNIFAILGLRSMYFLLAGVIERFRYLKIGLALVLVFVGLKMSLMDFYKVPIGASLAVIALLLGGSIWLSLLATRHRADQPR